jgi:hypothetical protein
MPWPKKRPPRGRPFYYSQANLSAVAIDDNRLPVAIVVVIPAPLDHDRLVSVTVITLADHFTVTVAVAMTGADGHTDACGTDANAHTDFFRTRRHRNGNSSHHDGSHYESLDHRMFLSMNLSEGQLALM